MPGTGASDVDLVRRMAGGDEPSFAELYVKYSPLVLAFVSTRLSDRLLAEEAASDTWLGCWRNAGTFRGESTVRAWLLGIARRQVLMRYRQSARRVTEVALEGLDRRDTALGPEAVVVAEDGERRLLSALAVLPVQQYETVMLAWVEQMPYPEIAEALGVPVGTVKSRISNARRTLATALSDQKDEPT